LDHAHAFWSVGPRVIKAVHNDTIIVTLGVKLDDVEVRSLLNGQLRIRFGESRVRGLKKKRSTLSVKEKPKPFIRGMPTEQVSEFP
jgi:hypothetical protein